MNNTDMIQTFAAEITLGGRSVERNKWSGTRGWFDKSTFTLVETSNINTLSIMRDPQSSTPCNVTLMVQPGTVLPDVSIRAWQPRRTVIGEACTLPFTYNGETYFDCAYAGSQDKWCSLEDAEAFHWDDVTQTGDSRARCLVKQKGSAVPAKTAVASASTGSSSDGNGGSYGMNTVGPVLLQIWAPKALVALSSDKPLQLDARDCHIAFEVLDIAEYYEEQGGIPMGYEGPALAATVRALYFIYL